MSVLNSQPNSFIVSYATRLPRFKQMNNSAALVTVHVQISDCIFGHINLFT